MDAHPRKYCQMWTQLCPCCCGEEAPDPLLEPTMGPERTQLWDDTFFLQLRHSPAVVVSLRKVASHLAEITLWLWTWHRPRLEQERGAFKVVRAVIPHRTRKPGVSYTLTSRSSQSPVRSPCGY